jgi:hypothetical protein
VHPVLRKVEKDEKIAETKNTANHPHFKLHPQHFFNKNIIKYYLILSILERTRSRMVLFLYKTVLNWDKLKNEILDRKSTDK